MWCFGSACCCLVACISSNNISAWYAELGGLTATKVILLVPSFFP